MATKNEKMQTSDVKDALKLEEAMRQLDAVVASLDSEQIGLEEAMRLYEEGVRLVRICHQKLQDAERTVRILHMSEEGEVTEEAFETQ